MAVEAVALAPGSLEAMALARSSLARGLEGGSNRFGDRMAPTEKR